MTVLSVCTVQLRSSIPVFLRDAVNLGVWYHGRRDARSSVAYRVATFSGIRRDRRRGGRWCGPGSCRGGVGWTGANARSLLLPIKAQGILAAKGAKGGEGSEESRETALA